MGKMAVMLVSLVWTCVAGCGYHTLGAATHLPSNVRTLSIPVFATRTEAYHTEALMTNAVIREFAARTRMRVAPDAGSESDAVLHGTILSQTVTPLTYNTSTQQSSSFLITMIMAVTLTDRDGKVLYENKDYTFRQQYQVSREVTSFFEEETPALQRMSQDFARTLVGDILEAF